jgi:hypothetical protein
METEEGSMGYSVDLSKMPVAQYVEILKNQNLLPGRRILYI